jgi:glycosyltransferase involved in cell wall biosynthesis
VFSSRTETQGLVLLEAMALGVPVVGLAVMGTADVLRHGRGAHIAEDDVHDFARRVSALLNDPTTRAELAQSAGEYAREWTAQEMTARLARFYEHTIGEHTIGAPTTAHQRDEIIRQTGLPAEAEARATPPN